MESLLINYFTVSQSTQKVVNNMLTEREVMPPVVTETINLEEEQSFEKKKEKGMLKMDLQLFANKGVSVEAPSFVDKIKGFFAEVKEIRENVKYTRIIKKESKNFDSFRYDPVEMFRYGIDFAGIVYDKNGYNFIYNHRFSLLDTDVQAFIVLHELGHKELGHLFISNIEEERMSRVQMGYAHYSELEADMYAACILGKKVAVKALKAQMEWAADFAKPELEFRINELLFAELVSPEPRNQEKGSE